MGHRVRDKLKRDPEGYFTSRFTIWQAMVTGDAARLIASVKAMIRMPLAKNTGGLPAQTAVDWPGDLKRYRLRNAGQVLQVTEPATFFWTSVGNRRDSDGIDSARRQLYIGKRNTSRRSMSQTPTKRACGKTTARKSRHHLHAQVPWPDRKLCSWDGIATG